MRSMLILLLLVNLNSAENDGDWIKDVPRPMISQRYGEWHVLLLKKVHFDNPQFYPNMYTVKEIDNKKLNNDIKIEVKYANLENDSIIDEVKVVGYELLTSSGVPERSDIIPLGYEISQTKVDFHIRNIFIAYVTK
jgi:hypothetical protein